jgi:orotate phosphoribosyltransferase
MAIDVLKELERLGAVIENRHFVYTSGKHGSAYINSDPMFPDVAKVAELADLLIEPFLGRVDTVVAPATGGIVLTVQAGLAFLRAGETVASVWSDKSNGGFVFERAGFTRHITNKRVLVVEDLLNTGGSVEKTCRLVEQHGGRLVGVSVVCNRGNSTAASLQVPELHTLAEVRMDVHEADACPLCAEARPIVDDLSHGDRYKAEHPDYAGGYISLATS